MFIAYFQSQWLENQQIAISEWNVSTLESYRINNHQERNNNRLSYRITPSIAGNLWTFPFCPERSLTPPGELVVDCTHVPDPREAPRPLLPYRHEVVTRWELQDWDRG